MESEGPKPVSVPVKSIVTALAVSAAVLVCAVFSAVKFDGSEQANADWMKPLDGSVSLSSLSIPGTHDSGALHSMLDLAGKCQDKSIAEQLNAGARFLDIRLKGFTDQLYVYHGIVNEELPFSSVLTSLKSFLDYHPGETVIVSIKEEQTPVNCTDSFEVLLKNAIDASKTEWLYGRTFPVLSEARGKCVLFSRYADNSLGIDAYGGWKDSTTFDIDGLENIHIQDEYRLKDNVDKWDAISECLDYSSLHPTEATINFMSGYIDAKILGISLPNAAPTAQYVNPLALDELTSSSGHTGIVLFDFLTDGLASSVVKRNG